MYVVLEKLLLSTICIKCNESETHECKYADKSGAGYMLKKITGWLKDECFAYMQMVNPHKQRMKDLAWSSY